MSETCGQCGNVTTVQPGEPCPSCGVGPGDVSRMVAEINASVRDSSRRANRFAQARVELGVGGVLLSLAAAWAVEVALFVRSAVPVTGAVVSATPYEPWIGTRKSVKVVQYSFGGTTHEMTSRERGLRDRVALLVSTRRPADARLVGSLWTWPLFLTVIGGTAFALGATKRTAARAENSQDSFA